MTEQMTTRTMTAAQAAGDTALWQAVERGEVRVTMPWYGRIASVVSVRESGYVLWMQRGMYDWQHDAPYEEAFSGAEFTVTVIPIADQSPNSPAAVERLTARVANLRAALQELYDASAPIARGIPVATEDAHHDFLTATAIAYMALHPEQVPVPDSTSPASASDEPHGYVESQRVESGAQNGTGGTERAQLDAGMDGYWADET